jgi:hypothetical protein
MKKQEHNIFASAVGEAIEGGEAIAQSVVMG